MSIVFGPVPSRRLGMSLGINNIPFKICSYSCIYCQIGRTLSLSIQRRKFYDTEEIVKSVGKRLDEIHRMGVKVDYLTFVPDGEPTLDLNLGRTAEKLKRYGVKVAILTNSSLIYRDDVKEDLQHFDLVSFKIDSVKEDTWRKINRPYKSLKLLDILNGMLEFRNMYRDGLLITETMLVNNIDYANEINELAKYLKHLSPQKAYIAIPTRPPAELWVKPASEDVVNMVYQEVSKVLGSERVELLTGVEPSLFVPVNEVEADLLSILSVHPMYEDALKDYLRRANASWSIIEELIKQNKIVKVTYDGRNYYMLKHTIAVQQ